MLEMFLEMRVGLHVTDPSSCSTSTKCTGTFSVQNSIKTSIAILGLTDGQTCRVFEMFHSIFFIFSLRILCILLSSFLLCNYDYSIIVNVHTSI
jgi:hypothetical protein